MHLSNDREASGDEQGNVIEGTGVIELHKGAFVINCNMGLKRGYNNANRT